MSAYVTYVIKAVDGKGEVLGTMNIRSISKPSTGQAVNLAATKFKGVSYATATRSIPARIGRTVTPKFRVL